MNLKKLKKEQDRLDELFGNKKVSRGSVVDILQEIYFDVCFNEPSVIMIKDTHTNEIVFHKKQCETHDELFEWLCSYIHARYTKVIIDAGYGTNQLFMRMIDDKYNHYIKGEKKDVIKGFEEFEVNGKIIKRPIIETVELIKEEIVQMVEVKIATREQIREYQKIIERNT